MGGYRRCHRFSDHVPGCAVASRIDTRIDLFRGLGPGDPGYRLRPGASGLDPLEAYMEQGRVIGLILKSLLDNRPNHLIASLLLLLAGMSFASFMLLSWTNTHIRFEPSLAMTTPILIFAVVLVIVIRNQLSRD
jgi:hypothetical protein